MIKSQIKKIYLLSLGCPRNLIDSEVLLGLFEEKGFTITEKAEDADVGIVNTCGFIQDAKQESIDMILQLAELKKEGKIQKLIVSGCLSQRYPAQLMDEIGEIDAVFGSSDFTKIPDMIDTILSGKKIKEVTANPSFLYDDHYKRDTLTPDQYAYVKIQEGCSNRCSYCVIPQLKGPRRSRTVDSVVEEIRVLRGEHNVKEIVLIGQDTTSFGIDTSGKSDLAQLIRKAAPVMEDGWVRLLYTHPVHFTDELIEVIADTGNICKYVDLPVQHINDRILQQMNRRVRKKDIVELIERIRSKIKNVTIRTSVIVGFPGETDAEFGELMRFLEETKLERLGTFIYSREEDTPAAGFQGQVAEDVKKTRFDQVMKLQQKISTENNIKHINKTFKALIDEADPSGSGQFTGRTEMDAPEVDGVVYVKGDSLRVGEFTNVRITGTMEYDLMGEAV